MNKCSSHCTVPKQFNYKTKIEVKYSLAIIIEQRVPELRTLEESLAVETKFSLISDFLNEDVQNLGGPRVNIDSVE